MYTAKLALAVVLAGGVPKSNESGNYAYNYFPFLYYLYHVTYNNFKQNKEHVYEENLIFSWWEILELVNLSCYVQRHVWLLDQFLQPVSDRLQLDSQLLLSGLVDIHHLLSLTVNIYIIFFIDVHVIGFRRLASRRWSSSISRWRSVLRG